MLSSDIFYIYKFLVHTKYIYLFKKQYRQSSIL